MVDLGASACSMTLLYGEEQRGDRDVVGQCRLTLD